MRYYVISGETSGDNHASRVISELKNKDPKASFKGMGGDQSEKAGLELLIHQKEMAIMGFAEVLMSIRKISRNLAKVKNDIEQWKPDMVLLVDYPGFNFKIAKYAHSLDIPVHYYISPKVWAWKEGRVKLIKKYVSRLYSILPFEMEYFQKKQVVSTYVGNPSKETVDEFLAANPSSKKEKSIALLPGSRTQEIKTSIPIMLEALQKYPDYKVLIAQAPGFDDAFYHQFDENLTLVKNDMYGLLSMTDAALVTSGTATLETALMNVPQVVCYKANPISYVIAKAVIKLKYISLVNLILDKPVITELIQGDFNPERINEELDEILLDETRQKQIAADYTELHQVIGTLHPSKEVANHIWNSFQ
ncbi:MAG: lipid-A-disaccharide synthase [Bacteroidia bacterium]